MQVEYRKRGAAVRMRCLIFLVFLAFPSAAIAANSAVDQAATIAALTQDVQELRAENERLSARLTALEKRFPAPHQTISITDHFDNFVPAGSSLPNPRQKQ
jgi:cell division protein FtsB